MSDFCFRDILTKIRDKEYTNGNSNGKNSPEHKRAREEREDEEKEKEQEDDERGDDPYQSERYIVMERLAPRVSHNYLISAQAQQRLAREGAPLTPTAITNEFGVYGIMLW